MSDADALPVPDTRPKPVPPAEGLAPGTGADWLAWAVRSLATESDSARADAEMLMAALLGCERSELYVHAQNPLEAATVLRYVSWIERRKLGEPVAYITGRQGFWTLDLIVDTTVLIPRPDTERLVEWACEIARELRDERDAPIDVLDLGTGSGAIALALTDTLRSDARITATDRSESALTVARENARMLNLDEIEFLSGHWFEPLQAVPRRFDLIVSNPPYIADHDPHLARLRYEPRLALTAGRDGLDALREIIRGAPAHLHPHGWLLLEHGHDQGAAVRELLLESGLKAVETRRDYGGNERVSGGRLS